MTMGAETNFAIPKPKPIKSGYPHIRPNSQRSSDIPVGFGYPHSALSSYELELYFSVFLIKKRVKSRKLFCFHNICRQKIRENKLFNTQLNNMKIIIYIRKKMNVI
jgi:hypothetical protein